jgi:anti-anti-sigma factor
MTAEAPPAAPLSMVVCELTGDYDVYALSRLHEQLHGVHSAGYRHVIADVRCLGFFDSSAIGALIAAYKRARTRGGTLVFVNPTDRLQQVLAITGLNRVFAAFATIPDAIAYLEQLS